MYYYYHHHQQQQQQQQQQKTTTTTTTTTLLLITFIHGIHNYVPEIKKNICRVYNVATILRLQFMVHDMLFPMLNILHFPKYVCSAQNG